MDKCIKMQISGRVQGVWFRKKVKGIAESLELVGYVKNIEDGTVLIEACGNVVIFDEFMKLCKKGSKLSNVTNIKYDIFDECSIKYKEFKIL